MLGSVGPITLEAEFHRSPPSVYYRGRHTLLGRTVLVRRLGVDPLRGAGARDAFLREQRHLASLDHPGILRPLDLRDADGALWAIHEFHAWRTTDVILRRRGPAPLADVAHVGAQVADTLAFLHREGHVHGCLTPAAVAVGRGDRTYLLDLAKGADLAAGLWPLPPGVRAWSPWSAPEELRGERPTALSDTYGLAAVLLFWLTGRFPRGGSGWGDAMERARAGAPPPDVQMLRPDVPDVLAEALRGCLQPDPARRRGSCSALGSLLDEIHRRLVAEVPSGFATGVALRLPGTDHTLRILGRHGSGAFGVLFRARDEADRASLAIKALKPEHRADPEVRQRFLREAEAAHAILHPNVVRIHGVGEHAGTPYVVMDFVDGPDLATVLLREGAMPAARAARVAAGIARGLAAIHEQGIVHRDLKPQNVLLRPDGEPVIADFGVAQQASQPRLTLTGALVGTPAYMAPEQVAGEPATPSTDLYALGAILYELLSGRCPFPGRDTLSTLRAIAESPPPGLPPEIPGPLSRLVMRLLAKRPGERFPSANAVLAALGEAGDLAPPLPPAGGLGDLAVGADAPAPLPAR